MSLQPEWIVVGALVVLALVAGAYAWGRRMGDGTRRVRELESRLEVAAQERERVEGELRGYRERVADHFSETSERLHELTVQYRAVYEHLAKGASELCPESFEKLEGGLGLDALPEESPRERSGEGRVDASAPLAGASPASREEAEAEAADREPDERAFGEVGATPPGDGEDRSGARGEGERGSPQGAEDPAPQRPEGGAAA
jgi:uncharacterized membrane-anchored protein YhcB (DUF1043 family)